MTLTARIHTNREKRKRIAHVIAGVVILIHAFERYETGHGSYVFFLIAGLVFIGVAIMHPVLERKFHWVDAVFFMIESCLSFIIAYEYFEAGKKALPFCYLAVAIFQLVLAFIKSKKGAGEHTPAQPGEDIDQ